MFHPRVIYKWLITERKKRLEDQNKMETCAQEHEGRDVVSHRPKKDFLPHTISPLLKCQSV